MQRAHLEDLLRVAITAAIGIILVATTATAEVSNFAQHDKLVQDRVAAEGASSRYGVGIAMVASAAFGVAVSQIKCPLWITSGIGIALGGTAAYLYGLREDSDADANDLANMESFGQAFIRQHRENIDLCGTTTFHQYGLSYDGFVWARDNRDFHCIDGVHYKPAGEKGIAVDRMEDSFYQAQRQLEIKVRGHATANPADAGRD